MTVQKTAPLNFCTPPDLHSGLYKTNGDLVSYQIAIDFIQSEHLFLSDYRKFFF